MTLRSLNPVDCDLLIRKAFATGFSVDLKGVEVEVEVGHDLLVQYAVVVKRLLLLSDVQVGTVWSLYSYN